MKILSVFKSKILYILLINLFVASCDDMDLCYYNDDFGEASNKDQFYVYSSEVSCFYNDVLAYTDTTQSLTVQSCIKNTLLSTVKDKYTNTSYSVDTYLDAIASFNSIGYTTAYCSDADPYITSNTFTPATGTDTSTATTYRQALYNYCVIYCTDYCSENGTTEDSKWTKASLKTSGSYLGISLSEDSYIYITVSGSIVLTGEESGNSIEYKKSGVNDTNYNFTINGGDYLELKLDYNENTINTTFTDIDSFKSRTVVYFETIKSDLVPTNDYTDKYKFQKPLYENIKCDYSEKSNNINNSNCYFDFSQNYSSTGISDTLTSYYSYNYKTSLFNNTYYLYSNNILNNVQYMNEDNSGIVNLDEDLISLFDNIQLIYKDYDKLDGYIWNNDNTTFYFEIAEPTKIAIKYIGRDTNSGTCKFSVDSTNNYDIITEGTSKTVENNTKTYENIEYSITPLITSSTSITNNNTWNVLKTTVGTGSDKEEIIFNQFSTASKALKSGITISLSEDSSESCHKGMMIKLIPLKDYLIEKTGLVFFNFIGTSITNNIKYNVVNTNALYTSSLTDTSLKISDFLEYGETSSFGDWQEVSPLTTSQIGDIDSDTFNDTIIKKSVFVKSGQIIRFDYSNWFELDGKTDIKLKTSNYGTSSFELDNAASINILTKERPAYFCVGSYKEAVDVESSCLSDSGTYSSIYVENGATSSKCYIENDSCTASKELVTRYYSINPLNASTNELIEEECPLFETDYVATDVSKMKLNEFWKLVYIKYNTDVDNVDNAVTSGSTGCYDALIKTIYEKTQECKSKLESNSYEIYKGVLSSDGTYEDYKTVYNTSSITLADKTESDKINEGDDSIIKRLNNFFVITDITTSSDYTMTSSLFYYYKKICTEDSSGVCLTENAVPMCYDLTSYNGSVINFLKRTLDNSTNTFSSGTIESYGTLTDNDIAFGATKLLNFNSSSGLIKGFVNDTENISDLSSGYLRIKYSDSIYVNSSSFLGMFILNDLKKTDSDSIKDYFIYNNSYSNTIIKLQTNTRSTYNNGENLAIIMGEDKINSTNTTYYSDGNDIYYLSSGNKTYVTSSASGTNGEGKNIIDIVKYTTSNDGSSSIDSSSPFKFDSDGNLINTNTGGIGMDIQNYSTAKEYISSNSESNKNLFFRIVDADDISTNNEGQYKIIIKEYDMSEDGIVTYFRDFFNSILNFIDGTYIKLLKNTSSGNFVACDIGTTDNDQCFIYSEDDVSSNGDSCVIGDTNCYKGCDIIGTNQTCVSVYDNKGFVKGVYEEFINDSLYIIIAKLALILSITWYGFGYFFGMSNFTQSEIIPKIIKVSFIYFMISPSGWDFFNNYIIRFFKDCIDMVLFLIAGSFESDLSSELTQSISNNDYSDKTVLFSACFTNLEMIFSDAVFNKILGLAFSGWIGLIYLYLVMSAVINYIIAVFTSMIMYLSAQVYMSLVFCFFPLVVLFMFFKKTEKTFDNWLSLLIGFAGQQIFLIMTLSFFNLLIYNFIRNTFSYTVCWLSIFNMNVGGIPLAAIQFWKIPGTSMASSGLNTINEGMPSFYSIITFYMLGVLMGKFITEMTSIGNSIFGGKIGIGGGMAANLIGGLNKAGDAVKDKMKDTGKEFYKGMADRMGGKALKEFGDKQKKEMIDRREKRNGHFKDVKDKTSKDMDNYKKDYNNNPEAKKKSEEIAKRSEFDKMNSKESRDADGEKLKNNKEKLKDTNISEEEYSKLTKENKQIEDRNNARNIHDANQKDIEKGKDPNASENDKKIAKQAEGKERKLIDDNYNSLSDDDREKAQEKATESSEFQDFKKNDLKEKQKEFGHKNEIESVKEKYGDEIKDAYIAKGGTEEDWNDMNRPDNKEGNEKINKMAEEYGVSHGLASEGKKEAQPDQPKPATPATDDGNIKITHPDDDQPAAELSSPDADEPAGEITHPNDDQPAGE